MSTNPSAKANNSSNAEGFVALLLHAHIPYVRHEEENITLEERWFFEAVVDSYLPLIEMMERLLEDEVPFQLTLSLSPTLLAMLEDSRLKKRLRRHLSSLCELAQREVIRLWGHADFGPTAKLYADQYHRLMALYDRLRGDLIGKFRSLRNTGCLELITCAATHAFLPLVKNDAALRAQLEAAVMEFRRHFGSAPAGIWLPECGYTPAVEPHLQALGIRYFVVDAHAHAQALVTPQEDAAKMQGTASEGTEKNTTNTKEPAFEGTAKVKSAAGTPLRMQSGACAFARDLEAGAQVWSAEVGYPSDANYREYYRDIGYDLGQDGGAEWEYLKPYVLPDGARIHTGFKYYSVTGAATDDDAKAPYHPARAAQKAQQDAEHFVASRVAQLRRLAEEREALSLAAGDREARPAEPPVIVCPYDAELFGHWWYEGHQWLEAVLRGLAAARSLKGVVVSTTTLGGYAAAHAPTTEASLPVSSWGRGGYAEVWLQPRSQWVHPLLHAAEDRMVLAAQKHPNPELLTKMQQRALNHAARELMLAQSSDWTFILDAETVTTYAANRIETHLSHFHKLLNGLETAVSDKELSEIVIPLERRSPFLPELHYRLFQTSPSISLNSSSKLSSKSKSTSLRILMLAWEYPPRVIGGLARAVCDLSKHLAAFGHEVRVITYLAPDCLPYERSNGVHIHRVEVLQSTGAIHFLDWVFQMNMAFIDAIQRLTLQGMQFDIIHAHDWLVFYAAKESKNEFHLPLLATIHATEYGRNQGKLDTPVQQRIHALENKLADEADQLVVCSLYMQQEVIRLFHVPIHKTAHIPNGVIPFRATAIPLENVNPLLSNALCSGHEQNRIIAFLGRLVYEKGVHILIAAMRLVLKRYPEAKLIIAGTGPELEGLERLAAPLGDRVSFTGFLDETDKSQLLLSAELCVIPSLYEPFGLVALEAMASGTPLIVSDTGGLAEIVDHGLNGSKVPPGDANALAFQIAHLFEKPDNASELAAAALNKVSETFHWDQISKLTTETYEKLILLHPQRSGIFPNQKEIMK